MSHIVNQQWAPNYLIQSYFNQPEAWVTAAGESINVEDMDREHALNAILMVERVRTQIEPFLKCHVWETPLYQAIKAHVLGSDPSVPSVPDGAGFVLDYGEGDDLVPCYLRTFPVRRPPRLGDRPGAYPYVAQGWCPDTGKFENEILLTDDEVASLRPL